MTAPVWSSDGPWRAADGVPVANGIIAVSRTGERLSVSVFWLEPGAVVPRHAHPNEEFGVVRRGGLTIDIDGESRLVAAGDTFFVPADVPHSAVAFEDGCELLECYSPPRVPAPMQERTSR